MSAPPRAAMAAAFAAIYLMWGGTFLAIRYAVAEIPPLLTIALRCAGGAAVLFGWLAARRALVRPTPTQWLGALTAGTLLFLGCHGLLAWAEQRISSGEAALFMTAIPLWLVVIDAALARRRPAPRTLFGLGLGVVGVAVLVWTKGAMNGGMLERAGLLISALAWAVGSFAGRNGARGLPSGQVTAMQLAAGSLVVLAASLAAGEPSGWSASHTSLRAFGSLVFLILGGTVLGFGAYTWLLRVASPAAVGTYAFVNPVIALGLGWLVGDNDLSFRTAVAAALVVGAVVCTRDFSGGCELGGRRRRRSPARFFGRPSLGPGLSQDDTEPSRS